MPAMVDSSSSTSWASPRDSSIKLAPGLLEVMAASIAGVETHAGGLMLLAYSGWILLMSSMSVGLLSGVVGGGLLE